MNIQTPSIKNRVTALIASGALAATMAMPAMAFAAVPEASQEGSGVNGSGSTDVTVQLHVDPEQEVGGNTDPLNPDGDDADTYGDNVAFSVPTKINFVADAKGELTGPSAEATYIQNHSIFGIHASSFDVDADNGWNIIKDGATATQANSVDFQFGVYAEGDSTNTDMLDAADYLDKKAVNKAPLWNMQDKDTANVDDTKVHLTTKGDISKVDQDLTQQTKIATIKTYVTPNLAS